MINHAPKVAWLVRVVDYSGAGIPDALVSACSPRAWPKSGRTDEAGRCELKMPEGPVDVCALSPGFEPELMQTLVKEGMTTTIILAARRRDE